MRFTIDYGIDLGTTNSAIACQNGERPRLLAGLSEGPILPSAVHFTPEGIAVTGKEAIRLGKTDPKNTAMEFKRLMGTKEYIPFPASGKSLLPEELSSIILRTLLGWAVQESDEVPKGAVITIPAMFQLPQNEATRRAAELAGIQYAPLLQEPIAAAIAHASVTEKREGYWMIYDLGGGTFDVSLVRSKSGRLQVIDHDGDNHLGGKDFDRLVAQEAVQLIRQQWEPENFKRSNPQFQTAFSKLKMEAERVRISLSEKEEEVFQINNIYPDSSEEELRFEMPLNRDQLEKIIRPAVLRSTRLCQALLSRNGLRSHELNGLVMVGGPTLTPCLPNILREELKVDARHHMNPMNIVAYGAAIFSSTQKLPRQYRNRSGVPAEEAVELQLEFESMTTNPRPLLGLKFNPPTGAEPATLRISRQDGGFDTGILPVPTSEAFLLDLELKKNALNVFSIRVFDKQQNSLPVVPSEFTIVHGMSLSSPPLSQSVGVMLADNTVAYYLKKGVALPARHTTIHATTVSLKKGQSGEAIHVPLIQGESERADRNKVIGILKIVASHIETDLPVGSKVEVTLSVDEFSHTSARAYVPTLEQWFDDVIRFDMGTKKPDEVHKALSSQMGRLNELEKLAEELSLLEGNEIDHSVRYIESLIDEGDADSVDIADKLIREMAQEIDQVEDNHKGEIAKGELAKMVESFGGIIDQEGSSEEKREMEALIDEFNAAIRIGDYNQAQKKKEELNNLSMQVYSRLPGFWIGLFEVVAQKVEQSGRMIDNASILIREGTKAASRGDAKELSQICFDLIKFLPAEEKERIISHIS